MDNNWEILLTKGLGKIAFGFSRVRVAKLTEIYGDISTVYDAETNLLNSASEDEFKDFLARNGMENLFSEDEIAATTELSESLAQQDVNIVDERRIKDHALALEYKDDALYSLTTDGLNTEIHHGEKLIFATGAKEILEHFQRLNGGASVYHGDVIFDKIGVLLSGFYYQNTNGSWRFYSEDSKNAEERFITLFAPSELDRYLTDEFTDVDFLNK